MNLHALIPLAAGAAVLLLLVGVRELLALANDRRRFIAGAEMESGSGQAASTIRAWDNRFRRTRLGRWFARELDLAGMALSPLVVAVATLAAGIAATWVIWHFLSPILAVLGLVLAFFLMRAYLQQAQQRRQEAIVAQMPELARVLANASYAGLSLPTALGVASRELAEPVRTELVRITDRLRFGASVEAALQEFRERVRSRETGVLISTLVVSTRSGGSLVTALRGIADSLEQRKETRRQIQTTLSAPMVTANAILIIGVGLLFLLNAIQPGTVDAMTRSPLGIAALIASGVLFGGGYVAIRAIARVEP
ncbi:MAG TPA: type II secretion system F family protein [Propioniciclava sp.]|uniref:type II secretion system F family protein n=1 Tax=Propioniciclava sp. TaxID=2038686 RepID=UPI002C97510C|nr:type II secretion system F family protein [Propioniciclava sp.]HRL47782.1 type II secretion system F family protein [Propioniciclava sp.]HRL80197.1 type II secretion system F family protein [Propioniciclava sp.]